MTTEWVDFKRLKEAIDIQMVLDHYGIKGLVKSGDELRGPCPIHKGAQRSKNFTVNIRKNAFKCFSKDCGASGNILDLVVAKEQCSVREAGIKLQEWFKVGESEQPENNEKVIEVCRGVYRDKHGAFFEVIAAARSAEDFADLVIYRELSGDYQFWVAPSSAFTGDNDRAEPLPAFFTLIKAL